MKFYKIWKTRSGLIGVNKMTLQDLIAANIMVYIIYFLLLMLAVQIVPILLLSFYVVLLWNNRLDVESGAYDTHQRLALNLFTIVSVIYFFIDFHFGWVSFKIFSVAVSKETFDSFAAINLSIGLVSTFLFFIGHEIFKHAKTPYIRLGMFVLIVFFGIKLTNSLSAGVINNVITQYNDADVQKDRDNLKEQDLYNQQRRDGREQRALDQQKRDAEKEQELKDFDKNFARDYLN